MIYGKAMKNQTFDDPARVQVSFSVKHFRGSQYNDNNPVLGLYSPMNKQTVYLHGTREEFEAFIAHLQECLK